MRRTGQFPEVPQQKRRGVVSRGLLLRKLSVKNQASSPEVLHHREWKCVMLIPATAHISPAAPPLSAGSVDGWFPAQSPLSHLQLIIPSLLPISRLFLEAAAALLSASSSFPFFHCFNASCQIECLWDSFLDFRALEGLLFSLFSLSSSARLCSPQTFFFISPGSCSLSPEIVGRYSR